MLSVDDIVLIEERENTKFFSLLKVNAKLDLQKNVLKPKDRLKQNI